MKKRILTVFLIITLIFAVFSVPACAYQLSGFSVNAEGVYLASLDTGDVLYSKNADERLYPASLTKIMTALVLLEKVPALDDEIITVSYEAIHSLDGTDSSMGNLKEDEQLTARQALYYLLMSSANECANAIAEHISGSNSEFVKLMNDKAAELGMENTHYVNPHGLHDSEHYTTPRDMYKLVITALEYDAFKEITSTVRYRVPATNKQSARTLSTTNFLQDKNNSVSASYYYPYASGVKTGYTDEAGRCLVSTASKNGYNYVLVLMKSTVYNEKHAMVRYEFGDSQALYEWAFNNFEYKTVVDTSTPVAEAKVELCWENDHVSLLLDGGLSAIMPKDADSSTVQIIPSLNKESFDAPIKKGEVMGKAEILYAGESLGYLDLVSAESLQPNVFLKIERVIKRTVSSAVFKLIIAVAVIAVIMFVIGIIALNKNRKKHRRYSTGRKRR